MDCPLSHCRSLNAQELLKETVCFQYTEPHLLYSNQTYDVSCIIITKGGRERDTCKMYRPLIRNKGFLLGGCVTITRSVEFVFIF